MYWLVLSTNVFELSSIRAFELPDCIDLDEPPSLKSAVHLLVSEVLLVAGPTKIAQVPVIDRIRIDALGLLGRWVQEPKVELIGSIPWKVVDSGFQHRSPPAWGRGLNQIDRLSISGSASDRDKLS